MVWLYSDDHQAFYNLSNSALSFKDGYEDLDLKQSKVFGFGTKVIFAQEGKRPKDLLQILPENFYYYTHNIPLTVDSIGRVWFYNSDKGLTIEDHGTLSFLGRVPDDQSLQQPGGVLPLPDGKVWIGGNGVIWELNRNRWRRINMVREDQLFTNFTQDNQGTVYAATGEGVYQLNGVTYHAVIFTYQHHTPVVVPNDGKLKEVGDCSFHKRYSFTGNCPGFGGDTSYEYTYQVRYFRAQPDGSIIYINNRVVARLKDGEWKSFAFDTFSIDSATVDGDGNIWVLSNSEGLFRLAANIFDDYTSLNLSSSK